MGTVSVQRLHKQYKCKQQNNKSYTIICEIVVDIIFPQCVAEPARPAACPSRNSAYPTSRRAVTCGDGCHLLRDLQDKFADCNKAMFCPLKCWAHRCPHHPHHSSNFLHICGWPFPYHSLIKNMTISTSFSPRAYNYPQGPPRVRKILKGPRH